MKKILWKLLIAGCAVFLCGGAAWASSFTIADTYWGAEPTSPPLNRDIVGGADIFDVFSADVSLSDTVLSVKIFTNFAGKAGYGPQYTPGGVGVGYGDLFLATAWAPFGTAPNYPEDFAANGTTWAYALHLDDRWDNGGTGVSLLAVNDNILLSDDFISSGVYRSGQEVAVKGGTAIANGDFIVGGDYVQFLIDLDGTALLADILTDEMLAIHWAMSCANDVIEGQGRAVPEPGTLLMIGFGLIGIAAISRKKFLK